MSDFNVRSDSVDVEQVMEQIRARIREKRGVDYTEQQIRELAAVKLEKILDPRGVRSDLLAEFRKARPATTPYDVPLYSFEESTLFDSHRGIVRFIRRLLKPFSKLVFNANALAQSLHNQVEINRQTVERLDRLESYAPLYYELLHNLVLELTRATIEVKNMKMRVESLASRLEFNERRARALESVVVYKTGEESAPPDRSGRVQSDGRADRRQDNRSNFRSEVRPRADFPAASPGGMSASGSSATSSGAPPAAAVSGTMPAPGSGPQQLIPQPATTGSPAAAQGEGPGQRSRRRRRRRGRRGGASAVATMGGGEAVTGQPRGDIAGRPPDVQGAPPTSDSDDAREARAEPFENAFGVASHPAEPQVETKGEPAPERSAEHSASSDPPDTDGQ
jgi:hypothetical protein